MKPQDYNTLATTLQERGYKKHNFCPADWIFYWGKVFHEEQEIRYEVIFAVQDYGINYYMEERDTFGVFPRIVVSRNRHISLNLDLDFSACDHSSIEEIEQKAQSFYEWAKQNLEI